MSKLPVPPGRATSLQKPEKTRVWALAVLLVSLVATVPVQVTVPVLSTKATGRLPMESLPSGGQSWLVGYERSPVPGPMFVPGVQLIPLFGPPVQTKPLPGLRQVGQGWMPACEAILSPARKRADDSGSESVVAPVSQVTVPAAFVEAALMTQTLVGVLPGFGTASGAPKRHPVAVQVRLLPVFVDVVAPSVPVWPVQAVMALIAVLESGTANGNGTELPPPPV